MEHDKGKKKFSKGVLSQRLTVFVVESFPVYLACFEES